MIESKNICSESNYHQVCKIPNTHDKFEEAHYFLHMMINHYHNADGFRFNMNAFIQALRNITFALQSEKRKIPNFDSWYEEKQKWMKESLLLRNFVEGRNIVVKRGNLAIRSEAHVGLFRYRKHKLGMIVPVNPFLSSEELLQNAEKYFVGFLIDKEHTAIGEQCGLSRKWVVEDIGEGEVLQLCFEAWRIIGQLLIEAHNLFDLEFHVPVDCEENPENYQVLLETDLNPKLIEEWGW
ncbi:hypothetical protein [Bacillus wiedmannii]|uniref:hypothetical protein n=1 Tax=Bacillus wiedmannii TaxID=1890302 RepID=UPI000BFCAA43|nr:hypothetical protein [Bacillus wiedmannii]PHG79761.1 hypothetical protein COI50_05295 [Bacillus wiedmannii]